MTARVTCAACGWTGRRKPGKLVECPKCGAFAAYQDAPQ
jgi:transposase